MPFFSSGVYKRIDLNMPAFLPSRPHQEFALDTPLTHIGLQVAFESGRALSETGMFFSHCYTSPALRCVQTATEVSQGHRPTASCSSSSSSSLSFTLPPPFSPDASCRLLRLFLFQVLRGLGQLELPIRIEPNLFEWLGWHRVCRPTFMRPEELREAGFNVDVDYRRLTSFSEWDVNEATEKYYERSYRVTKKILEATKKRGECQQRGSFSLSLFSLALPLFFLFP